MSEQVQTKPLQRWVGQTVYRKVFPTHGPHAYKLVAVRRGVIVAIYPNGEDISLVHETHFDVDINWHTLEVTTPPIPEGFSMRDPPGTYHPRVTRPFDFGLKTLFEYDLLVRGALLSSDGPTWDEPQPPELVDKLPFYQRILDNPEASYLFVEEVNNGSL